MDCSLPGTSVHGDFPGKNTGVGCHSLLQRIFPTQGSNTVCCTVGRLSTVWAAREAPGKRETHPKYQSLLLSSISQWSPVSSATLNSLLLHNSFCLPEGGRRHPLPQRLQEYSSPCFPSGRFQSFSTILLGWSSLQKQNLRPTQRDSCSPCSPQHYLQ